MKASRKWILQRASAIIVAPLIVWFCVSLISLSTSNYNEIINFFGNTLFTWLTIILLVTGFFHERVKNVTNLLTLLLSIIVPLITIILLLYKF